MKNRMSFRKFAKDESGTAYILAALSIVPMFGMAALAVDYTNFDQVSTDLETAAETVVLHTAKQLALDPNRSEADFITEGKSLLEAIVGVPVTYDAFTVDSTTGAVHLKARSEINTNFMHVFGHDKLYAVADKYAKFGRQNIEVAIAIDNSGSMAWDAAGNTDNGSADFQSRMDTAKSAVELLITSAANNASSIQNTDLKFSIVPWNSMVRVPQSERGTENNKKSWIDWDGHSVDHFRYLAPYRDGGDMYYSMTKRRTTWDQDEVHDEWVNYDPNDLKNHLPLIPGGEGVDLDSLENLADINLITRADVFNRIQGVSWAGCFDHRAGSYRTNFEAPTTSIGNSLYLPHFAPDEYDDDYYYGGGWEYQYRNNYISDIGGDSDFYGPYNSGLSSSDEHDAIHLSTPDYHSHDSDFTEFEIARARTFNSAKYAGSGNIAPYSRTLFHSQLAGPNVHCFVPEMVGLSDDTDGITNDKNSGDLKDVIDSMTPGGATDASIGIAWAMNTLTPHEPFDDAKAYGESEKILVIMTDGDNTAQGLTSFDADYIYSSTTLGYMRDDPLEKGWGNDGPTKTEANAVIDETAKEMCTNIKNQGVRIYFVYFGTTPSANATSLRDHCASTSEHAIYASSSEQLEDAFKKIGDDIGKLRLTYGS